MRFGTICTIKKHEKHPWNSVNYKSTTLLKLTLLHWCFLRFLNSTNGTAYHKFGNDAVKSLTNHLRQLLQHHAKSKKHQNVSKDEGMYNHF